MLPRSIGEHAYFTPAGSVRRQVASYNGLTPRLVTAAQRGYSLRAFARPLAPIGKIAPIRINGIEIVATKHPTRAPPFGPGGVEGVRTGAMRLEFLRPRFWPTWVGLSLMRSVELLPVSAQRWGGTAFGFLIRHLPLAYVRI